MFLVYNNLFHCLLNKSILGTHFTLYIDTVLGAGDMTPRAHGACNCVVFITAIHLTKFGRLQHGIKI